MFNINNVKFPEVLTSEQTTNCFLLLKQGNKKARNELIEHNLKLVVYIIKKFANSNENMDDLFSIGTIGLIKAIDSFSLEKEIKPSSYFTKCIYNEIFLYLRKRKENNLSLDESVNMTDDDNEICFKDTIVDKKNIEEEYLNKEFKEEIKDLIKILDLKEQKIITLYFYKELNTTEISKIINCSQSHVSRLKNKALQKLKEQLIMQKKSKLKLEKQEKLQDDANNDLDPNEKTMLLANEIVNNGMSIEELVVKYNISIQSINKLIKQRLCFLNIDLYRNVIANIKQKKSGFEDKKEENLQNNVNNILDPNEETVLLANEIVNNGMSIEDLSIKYNVSVKSINKLIKQRLCFLNVDLYRNVIANIKQKKLIKIEREYK